MFLNAEDFAPISRASRRGGVSAAVISLQDIADHQRGPVVPKDDATLARMKASVSNNVLFQHRDQEELRDLFNAMKEEKAPAGTNVITQGDEDGENFYILASGTVEVHIDGEKINEIEQGGSFGELALIHGTPRAATIKAKNDVILWVIDRTTYRRILMGNTIRKLAMYESFLEKVKLLESLDKWERLTIADALEPVEFEAGARILTQGEDGDEFFIIVEGTVDVTQTNTEGQTGSVGHLGPADYFGEIALINHEPRKATVTALTAIKAVKLDRDRFERVLGPCEEILRRNIDNYRQYKSA